jgi:hypothetical protein
MNNTFLLEVGFKFWTNYEILILEIENA